MRCARMLSIRPTDMRLAVTRLLEELFGEAALVDAGLLVAVLADEGHPQRAPDVGPHARQRRVGILQQRRSADADQQRLPRRRGPA